MSLIQHPIQYHPARRQRSPAGAGPHPMGVVPAGEPAEERAAPPVSQAGALPRRRLFPRAVFHRAMFHQAAVYHRHRQAARPVARYYHRRAVPPGKPAAG